jgi:drug/metabolite transporter (DMT)-like permease
LSGTSVRDAGKALGAKAQRLPLAGLVFAVLGAVAFSGKAIVIKLSYRYGVDAMTLIMLRMLFALPFFLLMAAWAEFKARRPAKAQDVLQTAPSLALSFEGRPQRQFRVVLNAKDMRDIAVLGFMGYYFSSFLDILGLQYVSASLERLILYLNPTLVLLLGWVFLKRRVSPKRGLAMGVSYLGLMLAFGTELSLSSSHVWLGSGLIFCSALTYAGYMMLSERLLERIQSLRLVAWASCTACACCLLQFTIFRSWYDLSLAPEVFQLALINATVCTVMPIFFVMKGIELMGGAITSQVGMIGPMTTLLMSFWILGEPLNPWIGLGTLLVLGGVFLVSRIGVEQ